jgi:predicted RND superfamily exporter protein
MKSTERLGQWIADNPIIIMAAALLLTLASLHYAQQIEMQGMTTESMVGKDSPLYQLFDHLYVEKFATESIAVLIETEDVTKPDILRAMDKLSQKMRIAPDVLAVTSIADIVADTEKSESGIRIIPTQERIDEILSYPANLPAVNAMMPDKKHTMLSIDLPVSLKESQLSEIYLETFGQVKMAEFPPDVGVTVTGKPALMNSITGEMAKSNGPILGRCSPSRSSSWA